MDTRHYGSLLGDAIYRSNRWMVVAILLAFSNLALLATIYFQENYEKVILLPPKLERSVWVQGSDVSDSYLEQMAVYIAELSLSYHPDNVDYRVQQFLRYTDPTAYGELAKGLQSDAVSIKRNRVSAAFYPKSVRLRPTDRKALVTGIQTRMVGGESMDERQLSLLLSFSKGSSILITQMQEVQENAFDPFVVQPSNDDS